MFAMGKSNNPFTVAQVWPYQELQLGFCVAFETACALTVFEKEGSPDPLSYVKHYVSEAE